MRKWLFFMLAGYLWKKFGEKRPQTSLSQPPVRR